AHLPQLLPAPSSLLLQNRRHLHALDSAWHDAIEVCEISDDVECEPMPGHPLLHVNADARDLLAPRPHARVARIALRGAVEDAERLDECVTAGAGGASEDSAVGGSESVLG